MRSLDRQTLQHDLKEAAISLQGLASAHGKDTVEYKAAQTKLLRLWFVLKMTRHPQEFLVEVQSLHS